MCYHAGSDPGKVGENFMQILRASEDYLETMLMMQQQHGYIRSIDIADHLGVTKPSVSYATKRLRENGFITMDHSGFITLTDSGMEIADRIYSRHKMLTDFFTAIGVSPEIARTDACKVEHDISEETFKAMSRYNEILKETQNKAAAES